MGTGTEPDFAERQTGRAVRERIPALALVGDGDRNYDHAHRVANDTLDSDTAEDFCGLVDMLGGYGQDLDGSRGLLHELHGGRELPELIRDDGQFLDRLVHDFTIPEHLIRGVSLGALGRGIRARLDFEDIHLVYWYRPETARGLSESTRVLETHLLPVHNGSRMKLLLWDVDLTLISTGGAGIRGLDRAFSEVFGWPDAMDQVHPQGKTDPAIIREVCVKHGIEGDGDIPGAVESILACYPDYLAEAVIASEGYQVLPGVLEILDALSSRDDVVLGLATGNIEEGARIKLDRGGLNPYFPFGGFGQISEHRVDVVREAARRGEEWMGRAFASDEVYVIGDTPNDVEAGRAAGFQTVAVATGSHDREQLDAAGAGLVIEDFSSGRDQFMRSTRIE